MNPLPATAKAFLEERDRWLLWLPVGIGVVIALYFALASEPPLIASHTRERRAERPWSPGWQAQRDKDGDEE